METLFMLWLTTSMENKKHYLDEHLKTYDTAEKCWEVAQTARSLLPERDKWEKGYICTVWRIDVEELEK